MWSSGYISSSRFGTHTLLRHLLSLHLVFEFACFSHLQTMVVIVMDGLKVLIEPWMESSKQGSVGRDADVAKR